MTVYCDACGRKNPQRRTPYEGKMICRSCYDKAQGPNIDDLKIPKKGVIIYLWDQRLALMGKYVDGTKRLIVTIPKAKTSDFFPNEKYDIIFKLRPKKKEVKS